jgi:hypothetical protein
MPQGLGQPASMTGAPTPHATAQLAQLLVGSPALLRSIRKGTPHSVAPVARLRGCTRMPPFGFGLSRLKRMKLPSGSARWFLDNH